MKYATIHFTGVLAMLLLAGVRLQPQSQTLVLQQSASSQAALLSPILHEYCDLATDECIEAQKRLDVVIDDARRFDGDPTRVRFFILVESAVTAADVMTPMGFSEYSKQLIDATITRMLVVASRRLILPLDSRSPR